MNTHNYSLRRLPPYGKLLAKQLSDPPNWKQYWGTSADGNSVSLFVVIGPEAWEIAKFWKEKRLFLIAPPGEDHASLNWSHLAGHDPVLIYQAGSVSSAELDNLAAAVLRDGACRILVLEHDGLLYIAEEKVV